MRSDFLSKNLKSFMLFCPKTFFCVCVCACVNVFTGAFRGQRVMLDVFISVYLILFCLFLATELGLCRPGWPGIACYCLPIPGIKGMCHHAQMHLIS